MTPSLAGTARDGTLASAMTELEYIEAEGDHARQRLARGGYELVFAGAATYVAGFVVGGAIVPILLVFAGLISLLVGLVDTIEGGTRLVLARREARQLRRLPAARARYRAIPPP